MSQTPFYSSAKRKRDRGRDSQPRPRPRLKSQPQGATQSVHLLRVFLCISLAHQNRSDFCNLRLRCLSRTPEIARFPRQEKAMLHCDLRVRWKVASDLRFRAANSEPKAPSFCGISGDLAPSTRKSLAIAIVRFWCAKCISHISKRESDTYQNGLGYISDMYPNPYLPVTIPPFCLFKRQRIPTGKKN